MKVAIITPFHSESVEWLNQAHNSVRQQTHPCDHMMIGDASVRVPPSTALHIPLPRNVADYGDTPRAVGVMYAAGLGYDAVCFLDGDNWLDPDHVASVVELHRQTHAQVVTSERMIMRLDGTPMARCVGSDGNQFCDTNCLTVFRSAFHHMAIWATMSPELHPIDDRVVWKYILDNRLSRAHTAKATVRYRATAAGFYRDLSEPVPKEAKESVPAIRGALKAWAAQGVELPIRWAYRDYRPPQANATLPILDSSAVLYFHPEAYTTAGPKLMGRNAAGESFLKGYLQHVKSDELAVLANNTAHLQKFQEVTSALGNQRPVAEFSISNLAALDGRGTVYYPGPAIGAHAWQRAMFGHGKWSLCGITHTTSSARAMDAICELLTAPVQAWDALICTSNTVKDNVEKVLQGQAEYLKSRLGSVSCTLPQLPVIPLGVNTQDFSYSNDQRLKARNALNVGEDTLVVLFMGRLSFHAKAHPLAMYQAIELAAKKTGKSVVLVECGWHANDFIAKAYQDAAARACPQVSVITLDGRDPVARDQAWAMADVFCSLSDNIQETFGIAPIEAMAAGLPVVVSDWDGYRDTVLHEVNGFRIPTTMPEAGWGRDLAQRHALELDTYDMYCGYSCSLVAVDVALAAQALEHLFMSAELRRRMGAAGRERARQVYDWSVVIAQYEELWGKLNATRVAQHGALHTLPHPWPARMDPFAAFASYPTRVLKANTLLCRTDSELDLAFEKLTKMLDLEMVKFASRVLPSLEEMKRVLAAADAQPRMASQLLADIPRNRHALVFRGMAHLLKLGLLRAAK